MRGPREVDASVAQSPFSKAWQEVRCKSVFFLRSLSLGRRYFLAADHERPLVTVHRQQIGC